MQLQGYLEKIRKRTDRHLRGIVVAPYIRKSALPLLESLKIEFIKVAPEQCFAVLKTQKDMKISQFIAVSEDDNSKLI
jgi:RecB family endonuclease NucS